MEIIQKKPDDNALVKKEQEEFDKFAKTAGVTVVDGPLAQGSVTLILLSLLVLAQNCALRESKNEVQQHRRLRPRQVLRCE